MSKRILVFLTVVVMAISSFGIVGAQTGTDLRALALTDITLYANPSETAETVADVASGSVVTLLSLDQSGTWAEVQVRKGTGYAPLSSLLILDIPALADTAIAYSDNPEGVLLYASPSITADIQATISNGTSVSVVAVAEAWALIETSDGVIGWVFESALPAGAMTGIVALADNPELGVFAKPQAGSDLVATVPNGDTVYVYGDPTEQWIDVETMDGTAGYVFANKVLVLPNEYVQVEVNNASGGIYAEPSFTADLVADLENGTTVYFMGAANDFWIEVFDMAFGEGYGLAENFGTPYYTVSLTRMPAEAQLSMVMAEGVSLLDAPSAEAAALQALDLNTVVYVYGETADGFIPAMLADGTISGYVALDAISPITYQIAAQPVSAPTGVKLSMILSGNNPEVGLFVEGQVGSDLVTTIPGGELVYVISEPVNGWTWVKLLDGETSGWVINDALSPDLSDGAIYAAPDFGAEVVANIASGTTVSYVGVVDSSWIEVYDMTFGLGYAPAINFSNPYSTGTIALNNAIVRAGPNDNLYNAIAQLPAGTEVVVKGRTENGAWLQVSIPFSELDFGYYGVGGWISAELVDVDASQLAVTG